MKVSDEKETSEVVYEMTKCAGDVPLSLFDAELPSMETVFPDVKVVEESVGCVDVLRSVMVKLVSLKTLPDATEYASLMLVQLVYVTFTQKGSRALVEEGVT